jgi:hypothetical protein
MSVLGNEQLLRDERGTASLINARAELGNVATDVTLDIRLAQ